MPKADQDFVIFGEKRTGNVSVEELADEERWYGVKGFFDWLESKTYKMHVRVLLSRYRTYTLCADCRGGRFQPAALNFRMAGQTLPELAAMPVERLADVIATLKAGIAKEDPNTEMLRNEVETRLRYLAEVGLGYLTLDRATKTLSGGEVERVNLTTCLGASLVNALFVMDEPSVGLHQRDIGRLVRVMKNLRDKGNTLLVVEHEESVIRAADNLIELGPGRGEAGGGLVFNGPVARVESVPDSLTGDYLAGRKSIPVPKKRRAPKHWLEVKGAAEHNLRKIDVRFPLGLFTCVTGVSGSGKSTLVNDVLYENFQAQRGLSTDESGVGRCAKLVGTQRIESIVLVDQSPLSRTPRSSPAVYLGAFDPIRELFAQQPEAAEAGLTAGSFSFNSGKGRCDRCCGNGFEKIEMQFLSDVFVRCPECDGKRYQPHILKIKIEGKSIHDVLESTVTEAIEFFSKLRAQALGSADAGGMRARLCQKASDPLRILEEVGLGYLRLGQPLNVLSGGESQRLKLVGHLTSQGSQESLLIFDEPTTGLHFDDIALLVKVFDRLVAQGNTLVVIEHNLDVIKCADHVIDLGPEAGEAGGLVVAAGTPEEVAEVKASHTGRYLRAVLRKGETNGRAVYSDEPEEYERAAEAPAPYALRSRGIEVRGAREHNLKNISLSIPRDQMVVVTGLSGSGKSTLAFDILFAEGQRRFLDSMSPYARQFVEQLEKPEVDLDHRPAAERRHRAARHARRRKVHRRDRHGGLSFSAAPLREARRPVVPQVQGAGRGTEHRVDRRAGRDSRPPGPGQGPRHAHQGPQGLPHRGCPVGAPAWLRDAAGRRRVRRRRRFPETRAVPRAYHRRPARRGRGRSPGARPGRARPRDRQGHGAAARYEGPFHHPQHGNELPEVRRVLRGTRPAALLVQLPAWLVHCLPRLWRGLGRRGNAGP